MTMKAGGGDAEPVSVADEGTRTWRVCTPSASSWMWTTSSSARSSKGREGDGAATASSCCRGSGAQLHADMDAASGVTLRVAAWSAASDASQQEAASWEGGASSRASAWQHEHRQNGVAHTLAARPTRATHATLLCAVPRLIYALQTAFTLSCIRIMRNLKASMGGIAHCRVHSSTRKLWALIRHVMEFPTVKFRSRTAPGVTSAHMICPTSIPTNTAAPCPTR